MCCCRLPSFEREVTSERIRDKIAASKRKGLWVGGMAPLGYDTKDRKISINDAEAERVRTVFRSYLRLGSLNRLMADLRDQGIATKVRTLKTGETVGGIAFTRGPLAHLLRNRFYIGEVAFKGEVLPGEQPAIVDRQLFDAVQVKLTQQVNNHKGTSNNGRFCRVMGHNVGCCFQFDRRFHGSVSPAASVKTAEGLHLHAAASRSSVTRRRML